MNFTDTDPTVEHAKAIVTAFVVGDQGLASGLVDETEEPVLVATVASLAASVIKILASSQGREPQAFWADSLLNCAQKGS